MDKSDILYSRYLFSGRADKPKERRGERREQPEMDRERAAASSTRHSLVGSGDGLRLGNLAHWSLNQTQTSE